MKNICKKKKQRLWLKKPPKSEADRPSLSEAFSLIQKIPSGITARDLARKYGISLEAARATLEKCWNNHKAEIVREWRATRLACPAQDLAYYRKDARNADRAPGSVDF